MKKRQETTYYVGQHGGIKLQSDRISFSLPNPGTGPVNFETCLPTFG